MSEGARHDESAREKHPKTCRARNSLAWLLVTVPDPKLCEPAEAVELARLNTRAMPKKANYWGTLGTALYVDGKHVESLKALSHSMELRDGGNSFDWFIVAMSKHKLSQKNAREWYDKAVAWMDEHKPDDEELKRFRAEASELLGTK